MHTGHTWEAGTTQAVQAATPWISRLRSTTERALSAVTRFAAGKVALFRTVRHVRRKFGKGALQQLNEIVRLRLGQGRLHASNYYAYELYDDTLFTPATRRTLVDWDDRKVSTALNDPHWFAVADDKLVCYAVLQGLGLRHPAAYALYHAGGRTFGSVPTARSPAAMADFLRNGMRYPFFAKPIEARKGAGASAIVSLDPERDVLRSVGGDDVAVADYIERFVTVAPGGYIFQELLQPHPAIQRVCGDRTSTIRVLILNGYEEPTLLRVLWRIPVGKNITDNFLRGTSGNLMGFVDPATGRVQRVIRGPGPDTRGLYGIGRLGSHVDRHPDTAEPFEGFVLPDWDNVLALCHHAAAAVPGLRFQAWDIAVCPEGPVIVELNAHGGLGQIPGVPGFNDDVFQNFLAKHRIKLRRRLDPA